MTVAVAFAAGLGAGWLWHGGVAGSGGSGFSDASETNASTGQVASARRAGSSANVDAMVPIASEKGGSSSSDAFETNASTEMGASAGRPESTVEIVVDNSSEPEPEVSAAHAARRAKRRAAREVRSEARGDFLKLLNFDLLTAGQRARHELYLEATETCEAVRKEIVALRTEGRDVPLELLSRLADAESVLRANRDAEYRALREAAARSAGLDEPAVRQLVEDLRSIDSVFGASW